MTQAIGKFQVNIAPSAVRDLKDIVKFISRDNPTAARNLAQAIRGKINIILGTNPNLCPSPNRYPALVSAGYRRLLVHKHYSVLYVVKESTVEVMHIWDKSP